MNNSGIGLSMVLVAVGAILLWAVDATVAGLDIKVVGIVLMVVGVVGMVLTMLFWASFAPFGTRDDRERHDRI